MQKTTHDANVGYWIKKHKESQISLDQAKEFNRREVEALKITIHKLQEDLTESRKSLTSLQNQKSAGLGQGLSLEECKKKSNESFQTKFALIKTFHDDEKAGLIDSHHKLVSEKEDQIKALRYGISNMKTKYDANFQELSDLKDSFEKSKENRDTKEDLSKKLHNQIELLIKEAKDKDECFEK
jgi:phage shock protein A